MGVASQRLGLSLTGSLEHHSLDDTCFLCKNILKLEMFSIIRYILKFLVFYETCIYFDKIESSENRFCTLKR